MKKTLLLFCILAGSRLFAQNPAGATGQNTSSGQLTAAEDHRNMMEQLGIKSLRPGPSGNESE